MKNDTKKETFYKAHVLDNIFSNQDEMITCNFNTLKFKSQYIEKQYKHISNIPNYSKIFKTVIFIAFLVSFVSNFFLIFWLDFKTNYYFLPMVGIIINLLWFTFSLKKIKKCAKVLKYLNFFFTLFLLGIFYALKLNNQIIKIQSGDLAQILSSNHDYMTGFYHILSVSVLANVLMFQKHNITIIATLIVHSSLILFISLAYFPSINSMICQFKEIFKENFKIVMNEDNNLDNKINPNLGSNHFFVSYENLSFNFFILDICILFGTNILAIILKNIFINKLRFLFLLYFKYQKYYENGKDYFLNKDEYQISIIKSGKSVKVFLNDLLRYILKDCQYYDLFANLTDYSSLSNQNNMPEPERKLIKHDTSINNLLPKFTTENVYGNNVNILPTKNIIFTNNILSNPQENNKYRIQYSYSARNNKIDIENLTSQENSEQEKILLNLLDKIKVDSAKSAFSDFILDNKISSMKDFFEILKNGMYSDIGNIRNNQPEREKISKSKNMTNTFIHPLHKKLFIDNKLSFLGTFYLSLSEQEKIFFNVKLRFIKELDVLDIIITELDGSKYRLKNLKKYFIFNENLKNKILAIEKKTLNIVKSNNNDIKYLNKNTKRSQSSKEEKPFSDKLKFFSNITHELKTPINSIIGLINKMKYNDTKSGIKQDDIESNLNLILCLSNYTIYLINDIIQYSQLRNKVNVIKYNIEQINLREILEFCYNITKCLINCNENKSNSIKVIIDYDQEIQNYHIRSDEIRLKQIILNLISNSVKFTKRGSIIIKAEISQDKKHVWVSVMDTGLGIKEDDMRNLFKENVMLHDAKKINTLGTGLGLSIIKNFAEKLAIKIFIESKVNVGSVFKLQIPCLKTSKKFSELGNNNNYHLGHTELFVKRCSKFFNGPIINLKKSSSYVNKTLITNMRILKLSETESQTTYENPTIIIDNNSRNIQFLNPILCNSSIVEAMYNYSPTEERDKEIIEKGDERKLDSRKYLNYDLASSNSLRNFPSMFKVHDPLHSSTINHKREQRFINVHNKNNTFTSNKLNFQNLEKQKNLRENSRNTSKLSVGPYCSRNTVNDNTTKLNETIVLSINKDELGSSLIEKLANYSNLNESYMKKFNEFQTNLPPNKNEIQSNNSVQNYYNLSYNYCCICNKQKPSNFNHSSHSTNNNDNNNININNININHNKININNEKNNIHENIPTILIVDDNQFIRESFKKIIFDLKKEKRLNLNVIEGNDGIDILNNIIADQKYGLLKCIFTDENMEYINGTEAIKIVRNLEKNYKISKNIIISLTSYEDDSSKEFINESGADFIISKPYSKNQILTALIKFNIIKN